MTPPDAGAALPCILREVRLLLDNDDNDFRWSTWTNKSAALSELDEFIGKIERGESFDLMNLELLFAPTGNIQEVSLSSGWGTEFCEVAARFDAAMERYKRI